LNVFFILTLFLHNSYAVVITDKKGRQITLEWANTLTEGDKQTSHPSYASQKHHYERIGKDFKAFFDDYNTDMEKEIKTEATLGIDSPERKYQLLHVRDGDKPCGFAYFKKKDDSGSFWYLEFIALTPEYQHSGIGRHLVLGIKEKFPKLRRMSLDTRDFNTDGQKTYESLGFSKESPKEEGYIHYAWEQKE